MAEANPPPELQASSSAASSSLMGYAPSRPYADSSAGNLDTLPEAAADAPNSKLWDRAVPPESAEAFELAEQLGLVERAAAAPRPKFVPRGPPDGRLLLESVGVRAPGLPLTARASRALPEFGELKAKISAHVARARAEWETECGGPPRPAPPAHPPFVQTNAVLLRRQRAAEIAARRAGHGVTISGDDDSGHVTGPAIGGRPPSAASHAPSSGRPGTATGRADLRLVPAVESSPIFALRPNGLPDPVAPVAPPVVPGSVFRSQSARRPPVTYDTTTLRLRPDGGMPPPPRVSARSTRSARAARAAAGGRSRPTTAFSAGNWASPPPSSRGRVAPLDLASLAAGVASLPSPGKRPSSPGSLPPEGGAFVPLASWVAARATVERRHLDLGSSPHVPSDGPITGAYYVHGMRMGGDGLGLLPPHTTVGGDSQEPTSSPSDDYVYLDRGGDAPPRGSWGRQPWPVDSIGALKVLEAAWLDGAAPSRMRAVFDDPIRREFASAKRLWARAGAGAEGAASSAAYRQPPSREDVRLLEQALEAMLTRVGAPRALGPPPGAAEDEWDYFDFRGVATPELEVWDTAMGELIRQVGVQCADRGQLLERVAARQRAILGGAMHAVSQVQAQARAARATAFRAGKQAAHDRVLAAGALRELEAMRAVATPLQARLQAATKELEKAREMLDRRALARTIVGSPSPAPAMVTESKSPGLPGGFTVRPPQA